jgi:hypothetical protein
MIEKTFYAMGDDFVGVCRPDISCPPFIIADAANNRLAEGATLDLPEGYNTTELNLLASIADRAMCLSKSTSNKAGIWPTLAGNF